MPAILLDGRAFARELREELQRDVAQFVQQTGGLRPQIGVVQVQGDAAAEKYVRTIRKLCDSMGVAFRLERLPVDVSQSRLDATIDRLSRDTTVHGVLIEMPLPRPLSAEKAILQLDHRKDVDGIHPFNAGLLAQGRPALVPNTPAGALALLRRYDIDLTGRHVAMVGHSAVVGRPLAALLLAADATVTVCHEHTRNMAALLRECDVVAVAVGKAGLITADMLCTGVVVVDFGINVLPDGQVVGDVDFAAVVEIARAITPVPGGTGPVTNVMLLRNVFLSAQRQMAL
ncbi:MAG: bifunctional 5,10-methylenetetrahydrofolate dehydrogenase/5,10-methenyltetrahydrofolate cyclohydrolase [Chloroflexaceae bacterium]|nr:bifunctional 5,10-methylenetetrahydrofolate dehydrogenase/5,10-methenyltetrahydrofolate cyclohydrolase [Chloroflexaceae bacterium]